MAEDSCHAHWQQLTAQHAVCADTGSGSTPPCYNLQTKDNLQIKDSLFNRLGLAKQRGEMQWSLCKAELCMTATCQLCSNSTTTCEAATYLKGSLATTDCGATQNYSKVILSCHRWEGTYTLWCPQRAISGIVCHWALSLVEQIRANSIEYSTLLFWIVRTCLASKFNGSWDRSNTLDGISALHGESKAGKSVHCSVQPTGIFKVCSSESYTSVRIGQH